MEHGTGMIIIVMHFVFSTLTNKSHWKVEWLTKQKTNKNPIFGALWDQIPVTIKSCIKTTILIGCTSLMKQYCLVHISATRTQSSDHNYWDFIFWLQGRHRLDVYLYMYMYSVDRFHSITTVCLFGKHIGPAWVTYRSICNKWWT